MRKLNKKGFTLIELLAVIVILAIIIMLVFPQITNVMNGSKVSTIHSKAKGLVEWWNTTEQADALLSGNWTIPSQIKNEVVSSSTWKCIGEIDGLAELFDITKVDYVLGGSSESTATSAKLNPSSGSVTVDQNTCSAVRYNSAKGLDVVLVAATTGKQYISGKVTYAFSNAQAGNEIPS